MSDRHVRASGIGRFGFTMGALFCGLLLLAGSGRAAGLGPVQGGALPGPLPLFPADNWWNVDISGAPVDTNSTNFVNFVGATRALHPDFGGEESPGSTGIYGIPYVVVDGTQPKVPVDFVLYGDESDGAGVNFYPIPSQAIAQPHWIEGGDPGNVDVRADQDRHLLIVDRDNKYLYELYNVFFNTTTGRWEAGSGAFWNMNTNNRRPEGWTSADAAGLAILPGLVRYDEVYDPSVTEIRHAFRVTVRYTNGHVYPASHTAGSTTGALPMGARLRLKASKDISGFTPEMQKVFRAMKRYGLIVADNGSNMYITGTFDTRWNNDILNPAFGMLTAGDFEVVQLGWKPATGQTAALASLGVSPTSVTGGQSSIGTVTLTAPAPSGGAVVTLGSANPAVASVPSSVTVGAGASSSSFSVTTSGVTATTVVGINASYGGVTKTASVTATPAVILPKVSSLTLNPTIVFGGQSATGTIKLTGAAPSGGAVVTLSTSNTIAAVPSTVVVAAGRTAATFNLTTKVVKVNRSTDISATYNGSTKTATLKTRTGTGNN